MAIITDWACVDILAILVAAVVGLVTYYKMVFKYWENRNVPYVQPKIPFGSFNSPAATPTSFGEQCKQFYDRFKAKGHKHVGLFLFLTPAYIPIDPEYVKNILSRDFDHFVDRGMYYNEKDDPLSAHLLAIDGAKWRNLRVKLTPTFTSGKMKMMFQTLVECSYQLLDLVDRVGAKKDPVDIKDVLARFTTDIIGSCAFGLDCNSCKDPNSEFRIHGKRILELTKFENLKAFVGFSSPKLARFLGICLTPKDAARFFMQIVRDTVDYREKNNIIRKDFMHLLIDLKNNARGIEGDEGKGLTIEEIAAQCFIFFVAGYETSSTTMTFCLFELALNPTIQQKLRDEVNSVLEKYDGKITYEAILEMKYMGQVIDETLRKYPPITALSRVCVKNYKVPGTDVVIEKGTHILIPALGLQRDAEYYPDPEKFDPERFSDENKAQMTPFTYLPFGEGPRMCIGLRFGLMQTKVGLAALLKNYKFSLNEKTTTPLKMDPFNFVLSVVGDIWLNVEKIDE